MRLPAVRFSSIYRRCAPAGRNIPTTPAVYSPVAPALRGNLVIFIQPGVIRFEFRYLLHIIPVTFRPIGPACPSLDNSPSCFPSSFPEPFILFFLCRPVDNVSGLRAFFLLGKLRVNLVVERLIALVDNIPFLIKSRLSCRVYVSCFWPAYRFPRPQLVRVIRPVFCFLPPRLLLSSPKSIFVWSGTAPAQTVVPTPNSPLRPPAQPAASFSSGPAVKRRNTFRRPGAYCVTFPMALFCAAGVRLLNGRRRPSRS